jgi:hypothetical protein
VAPTVTALLLSSGIIQKSLTATRNICTYHTPLLKRNKENVAILLLYWISNTILFGF